MVSPSQDKVCPVSTDPALQGAMPETSPVREVDVETFRRLNESAGVLVVYFFGQHCGPCKQFGPIVEELSQEMGPKLTIVKMDSAGSDVGQLLAEHRVTGIPTLVVFREGKEELRIRGVISKRQLEARLTSLVGSGS